MDSIKPARGTLVATTRTFGLILPSLGWAAGYQLRLRGGRITCARNTSGDDEDLRVDSALTRLGDRPSIAPEGREKKSFISRGSDFRARVYVHLSNMR